MDVTLEKVMKVRANMPWPWSNEWPKRMPRWGNIAKPLHWDVNKSMISMEISLNLQLATPYGISTLANLVVWIRNGDYCGMDRIRWSRNYTNQFIKSNSLRKFTVLTNAHKLKKVLVWKDSANELTNDEASNEQPKPVESPQQTEQRCPTCQSKTVPSEWSSAR